jgi:hypothetical protein
VAELGDRVPQLLQTERVVGGTPKAIEEHAGWSWQDGQDLVGARPSVPAAVMPCVAAAERVMEGASRSQAPSITTPVFLVVGDAPRSGAE